MGSARGKKKAPNEPTGSTTELGAAIAAVEAQPDDIERWALLETVGAASNEAGEVAETYRRICAERPDLAKLIGLRAVEFHDDWGEDPTTVAKLVEQLFAASPDARWALDRLKLTYSSDGRWSELLGVFDASLASTSVDDARADLLEDAARVAKDFARDFDRAIGYSERLYAISGDERTRASLEKLYEKCERHEALIGFYRVQVAGLELPLAQALRAKIASLWLTLGDTDRAFGVIEEMLSVKPDEPAAFELLERVFTIPARPLSPSAPESAPPLSSTPVEVGPRTTRQHAALLLKPHYVARNRSRELVSVLQVELAVATSDAERAATYRELVALQLDTLHDDSGAMFALAALVVLEPFDETHRRLLAEVSARLGRVDRRAKVLITAAERTTEPRVRASLLLEAALVCTGPLNAPPRAIELYQRVLSSGLDASTLLVAARELSTLLNAADRVAERCAVLERLAELETDPVARRAALGEVARIASADFGDTNRAIGAWRARLEDDPADADAISGMRAALASQSRFRELSTLLERAAAKNPAMRTALLLEAATLDEVELDDADGAIRLLEDLLAQTSDDTSVMDRLASLYRRKSRTLELVVLRRRQVALATNGGERIRLRLDIAAVLEEMGDDEERVAMLEANLRDDPRDPATLRKLGAALEALGRYAELLALWERQAELHHEAGDAGGASSLWIKSGALAEDRLADFDRAIADYERAGSEAVSLDALSRLYLRRDQPLDSALALERLSKISPADERVPILLRLASAYVAAGRRDSARLRLEEASSGETDARLRQALTDIYRAEEAWAPLADLLVVQAASLPDDAARADLLKEAAELYLQRSNDAKAAIPLLEQALAIVDNPVPLSLMLAPALVRVGRGDEAVSLLRKRIAEFGARRPKERALVHHALSRALVALDQRTEALDELGAAVKIDPLNLPTRRALADGTADAGDLESAQRMYRALLLVVPRQESASPVDISRSEILICLADVAERLNDSAEAAECFESALAAARENDTERIAAERELLTRGRYGVLADLLVERLDGPDVEQAALACDRLAAIYDEHLGRHEDAFAMRLRAISLTPTATSRHSAALSLARILGKVAAYVELARAECSRAKTPESSYELHSLLGAAFEEDDRHEDAAREYEQAERAALEIEPHATGGRRLDGAWKSLDRVYRRLGDDAARVPVLERRAGASEARREPPAERAELLYDLASIRLAKPETQALGLETLARATAASVEVDRTEMALLAALEVDRTNERALEMYERLSRAPGRERALIDALQRLGTLPHRRSCFLEASRIATEIGDGAGSELLLRRFVDLVEAGSRPSFPPGSATDVEIGGALLSLSILRADAGDVRESAQLKERAAARFDNERARPILLEVAALAAGPLADLPQAARIYSELLVDSPTDRLVWEPLLETYRALSDAGSLAYLVDSIAPSLDDPKERARLRLDQATSILRHVSAAPAPVVPSRPSDVVDDEGWGPVATTSWPSMRPPSAGGTPASSRGTWRPPGGMLVPRAPRATLVPRATMVPRATVIPRATLVPHASLTPLTFDHAEQALWKVLDDDPSSAEAITMLSTLFEKADRSDDLAKLLRRQLEVARANGDKVDASVLSARLGAIHEQSGRDDEAIGACRVAIELDPTNRAAHRALMRLSEKRQDPLEVAEATEILLRLEVGTEAERLALRLASLRDGLGDRDGVKRALQAGLERSPESQALRERLVQTYRDRGDWKELSAHHVEASETRVRVADRVEELRLAAAIHRRELADPAGAALILEKASKLAPNDRDVLLLLINSWSSAGEHARAIAAVDAALVDAPADQESLFHMRAILNEAIGAHEEALGDLETAFTLSGGAYGEDLAAALEEFIGNPAGADRQDLRMRLVEVLHGLDRVEDACTHLEEILRRDPEHRDARAILAALEAKAGRVDEAITSYTLLIAVEEGEPLVNVTLAFADLCEEHKRLEELVPALERARREVPGNEAIETRLRAAYTALGENRPLADLILDEAARQDDASEKFASLSKAARLLMDPDKGDPVRAMAVLADARALRPDDPDNGVLLADALIASGKIGEALDLLEQLVAGQKRRSKVRSLMHGRIADLYTKMGAQMGALQSLVKAMDDDPHDAALAMRAGLGAVELNDVEAMTRAFRTVTLMKTVPLGVTEGGAPAQAKCLAYYHLARVAQRQGDQRKARLMIEKSLGEFPTPEARALRDSLKG